MSPAVVRDVLEECKLLEVLIIRYAHPDDIEYPTHSVDPRIVMLMMVDHWRIGRKVRGEAKTIGLRRAR